MKKRIVIFFMLGIIISFFYACGIKGDSTYTITYDVNGGLDLEINEETIAYGEDIVLTKPSHESKIFVGWFDEDKQVTSGKWQKKENVTLVAKWMNRVIQEDDSTYVYFGEYPQTIETSSFLISKLSTLSTNSRGYLEYKGAEYKSIVSTPYESGSSFSNEAIVKPNITYYFRVEPLKWKVLSETNGNYQLMSTIAFDNTSYYEDYKNRDLDGETIAPNNYEYSNIRAWLNGYDGANYQVSNYENKGFYHIAFTEEEQSKIQTTEVDNSLDTIMTNDNSFICPNTEDKIYIPSFKDITTTEYGFEATGLIKDENRLVKASDYAIAKGCWVSLDRSLPGYTWWWLRSPYTKKASVLNVFYDGIVTNFYCSVNRNYGGCVAALTVTL